MKIENYGEVNDIMMDISMLKSVNETGTFDLKKMLWILSNDSIQLPEYEAIQAKINDWCKSEIEPTWNKIINDKLKSLEEL